MTYMDDRSLLRLVRVLKILVFISLFIFCITPIIDVFSQAQFGFMINGEVWAEDIARLTLQHKLVFILYHLLSDGFWLMTLYGFYQLGNLYQKGSLFTRSHTSYFTLIAYSLICIAVVDLALDPALAFYFVWSGLTPDWIDLNILDMVLFDVLAAGCLFLVLAKIMRRAADMRQETDLTI